MGQDFLDKQYYRHSCAVYKLHAYIQRLGAGLRQGAQSYGSNEDDNLNNWWCVGSYNLSKK